MVQNLSWLIVNTKQFQRWKSQVLFSRYAPLTHPVENEVASHVETRVFDLYTFTG